MSSVWSYGPAESDWRVEAELGEGRVHHSCAATPSGELVVAGGSRSGQYLGSVEVWRGAGAGWERAGELARPREYHSMAATLDTMAIFGGFYIEGFTNHYLARCTASSVLQHVVLQH